MIKTVRFRFGSTVPRVKALTVPSFGYREKKRKFGFLYLVWDLQAVIKFGLSFLCSRFLSANIPSSCFIYLCFLSEQTKINTESTTFRSLETLGKEQERLSCSLECSTSPNRISLHTLHTHFRFL